MTIQVLYFEGCPNHAPTVALVKQVVAKLGMDVQIEEVEVASPEEAVSKRFLGSPTVLVNGVDIDPRARERTDYGLSCRVYSSMSGLPSEDLLMAALQP
jgi:thioredoxin family protein